jgi:hypothetical protein
MRSLGEAKGQLAFSDRGRGSSDHPVADDPLLPIAGVQPVIPRTERHGQQLDIVIGVARRL